MATDSAKQATTEGVLTVEDILGSADCPTDTVPVPEWGGVVKVIGLTKRQQVDIRRAAMRDGQPDEEMVQRGIWLEGVTQPKFSEEHLGPLFEKNAGAVDRVLDRILVLSGMKEDSVKVKEKTFPS